MMWLIQFMWLTISPKDSERIMNSIQHFELDQPSASKFHARENCMLRVTSGRIWLTIEGQLPDVLLSTDEAFVIAKGSTAWLSAEPVACISIIARRWV